VSIRYNMRCRQELLEEIERTGADHKHLQEIFEQQTLDLKLQTEKYKESEKKLREEIASLEQKVKSTQTEEFMKLREDNKRLIQDHISLTENNAALKEKCHGLTQEFAKISKEHEALKQELLQELDDVHYIKAQCAAEAQKLDCERYVICLRVAAPSSKKKGNSSCDKASAKRSRRPRSVVV
jgi:hypothetical protein